jgi:hypothetical protein
MTERGSAAAPELFTRPSTLAPEANYQVHDESNGGFNGMRIRPDVPVLKHETELKKTQTGQISEHGHAFGYIRPMTQHPGAAVATFFNGLFTTVIGISTLGASITVSFSPQGVHLSGLLHP